MRIFCATALAISNVFVDKLYLCVKNLLTASFWRFSHRIVEEENGECTYPILRKLNNRHVAVNSNIKWWHTEEIWFTQSGYCLTMSHGLKAKTPSCLFDTAIQDGIDYAFGHLSLHRIFDTSELGKYLVTPLVALC